MSSHTGVCAFCGAEGEVTADHVPPQNLFASDVGDDELITVPGCSRCNGGSSLDDEYFRDVTASRAASFDHPGAQAPRRKFVRSLDKPGAEGKKKGFAKAVVAVRRPPVGRWSLVTDTSAVSVDIERLHRVVAAKIIPGLYYHETKEVLDQELAVWAFHDQQFAYPQPQQLMRWLQGAPWKTIRKGVFRYRYRICETDPMLSIWGMEFFTTPNRRGPAWLGASFRKRTTELEEAFDADGGDA
jgi:hypothetical protein